MIALDELSDAEIALLERQERDVASYVAVRLPPAGGMQVAPLPDGGHVLVQPAMLPAKSMTWQGSRLLDREGKPLGELPSGAIVAVELRMVVRRDLLCQDASAGGEDEEAPAP
jgi:hypothetical protein